MDAHATDQLEDGRQVPAVQYDRWITTGKGLGIEVDSVIAIRNALYEL